METKYKILSNIIGYIQEKDIQSFAEIVEYALEKKRGWLPTLCKQSNTELIYTYIESRNERRTRENGRT